MKHDIIPFKKLMEYVLDGVGRHGRPMGLYKTCVEQARRTNFEWRYVYCIRPAFYPKLYACGQKTTDDEAKDCFDQTIQRAIKICLTEE